jgi:heat shock protein HtpX
MYLSRTREYLADAGAIAMVRNNMGLAQALMKIQANHADHPQDEEDYDQRTPHENLRHESYIYWPNTKHASGFFARLFSTHPAIQDRLAAIGLKQKTP